MRLETYLRSKRTDTRQEARTRRRGASTLALAALVLTLGAAACDETTPAPVESSLEDRIVGVWSWTRAVGGIAGTERSPATEGITRRLTILGNGAIEVEENGQVVFSTTYEFIPSDEAGDGSGSPRLRYADPLLGGFQEQTVALDAGGDTLILTDPCCDGFQYFWERLE